MCAIKITIDILEARNHKQTKLTLTKHTRSYCPRAQFQRQISIFQLKLRLKSSPFVRFLWKSTPEKTRIHRHPSQPNLTRNF